MKLIPFERLGSDKGIYYSRDYLRDLVENCEFPEPIPVSSRRIAWLEAEIDEWIERRAAQRAVGHAMKSVGRPDGGNPHVQLPATRSPPADTVGLAMKSVGKPDAENPPAG
jgi:hypothetical protein